MLRKLFCITMSALLMFTGTAPAWATSYEIDTPVPTDSLEIDAVQSAISVVYDETADVSRYTLTLKESARFPDGTPVTAQDVLFSLYVYLAPDYTGPVRLDRMNIPGLRSYQLQLTEEQLAAGRAVISAIRDSDPSRSPAAEDSWTESDRAAYQAIREEYSEAAAPEFPVLAGIIVDYCAANAPAAFKGEFGLTAEEVLTCAGPRIAYAMYRWGYASYKDGVLTARYSHTVRNIAAGSFPELSDFADELRLAHNGDFASCWAIECPNPKLYDPRLPDVEAAFLTEYYEGRQTPVPAIVGIRMVDERTVEVCLSGVDMRSDDKLFSVPVLSLAECGDMTLWNPERGMYGYAPGEAATVPAAPSAQIYTAPVPSPYTMD